MTKQELIALFVDGHLATGADFAELISSLKVVQTTVEDPTVAGYAAAFIDSIVQDQEGKITVSKKYAAISEYTPVAYDGNAAALSIGGKILSISSTIADENTKGRYLLMPNASSSPTDTRIYVTVEDEDAVTGYAWMYLGSFGEMTFSNLQSQVATLSQQLALKADAANVLTPSDIDDNSTAADKLVSAQKVSQIAQEVNEHGLSLTEISDYNGYYSGNEEYDVDDMTIYTVSGDSGNYYINLDGTRRQSDASFNWMVRIFETNGKAGTITCRLGSTTDQVLAIALYNSYTPGVNPFQSANLIGSVPMANGVNDYTLQIPSTCRLVAISNRGATLESPTATIVLNGEFGSTLIDGINQRLSDAESAILERVETTEKGAANGVATLGADGKVPTAQLPTLGETYTAGNGIEINASNEVSAKVKTSGGLVLDANGLAVNSDSTIPSVPVSDHFPTSAAVKNFVENHVFGTTDIPVVTTLANPDNDHVPSTQAVRDGMPYFTPEMFGAVGDGATDDSTAIQDAIDAAAVSGGVVLFASKTYEAQGLVPANNVTLRGSGKTVIRIVPSATHHLIEYVTNQVQLSNFNIYNITFTNKARGGAITTLDVARFDDGRSSGYTWTDSTVADCSFEYGRIGMFITSGGALRVLNTKFSYNVIGFCNIIEHVYLTNITFWGNVIGAYCPRMNHATWYNVVFGHNTGIGLRVRISTDPTDGVSIPSDFTELGINDSSMVDYGPLGSASFENGIFGGSVIDSPKGFVGDFKYFRLIGIRFIGCPDSFIDGFLYECMISSNEFGAYSGASTVALKMGKVSALNQIVGNMFSTNATAIMFSNSCNNNNVVSNVFTDNVVDVELYGMANKIQSNGFRGTKRESVKIHGEATTNTVAKYHIIANNNFYNTAAESAGVYPCISFLGSKLTAILITGNSFVSTNGKATYGYEEANNGVAAVDSSMLISNIAFGMASGGYRVKSAIVQANNIGTVVTT